MGLLNLGIIKGSEGFFFLRLSSLIKGSEFI